MHRLALPIFLTLVAQPAPAAPLYECTTLQTSIWDGGALQPADHLAERIAAGEVQFRLDPERGLEYPAPSGQRWTDLFIPVSTSVTPGANGMPKAQLLATTPSGSDSIRIVTEGDMLAFVWTTWGLVDTGTCTIIESTTE